MSRQLILGPKLSIPTQAVTETFGILAARGAGKSNTAAVMAEEMFAAGLPFVVVDPVRAWWGLRSSQDGKGPGLPIPIFGGPRGDVPLERGGGNLTADLIVDQRLSCVLDLSNFDSEGSKKAFLLDFARRLYQRNEQPLHLFLEEADDYIPQKPMRDEAQLLRAWENIVRRGRGRGLGCTLITQRSASLNKNVLTQVQTLIAMRTTGPQDIAAIEAWVKYYQQSEKILSSLASLGDGEAWVWSPHFLKKTVQIQFRLRQTFDSGATPKVGQTTKAPATLADIDLAAVKKRMAATIEKAKAEDPRELRRELAAVRAELSKVRANMQPSMQALAKSAAVKEKRIEVPVLKDAQVTRLEKLFDRIQAEAERHGKAMAMFWEEQEGQAKSLVDALKSVWEGRKATAFQPATVSPLTDRIRQQQHAGTGKVTAVMVSRSSGPGDPAITGGLRRMMIALAQRMPLNRGQLGIRAGVSPKGGSFDTYLSRARTAGWIDGRGEFVITPAGLKALGSYQPLPEGSALLEYWLNKFGGGAHRMLKVLAEVYPKSLSREELGEASGVSPAGGSFDTYLSRLRTLELIEGRGEFKASAELFD